MSVDRIWEWPPKDETGATDLSTTESLLSQMLERLEAIEEAVGMSGDNIIEGERNDNDIVAKSGSNKIRIDPFSNLCVTQGGYGQFFEAARMKRIFSLSTAVGATLNSQTNPLGAGGTALLALHNPLNSPVIGVILRASCQVVEGATPTPSAPCWNFIPTPTGITAVGSQGGISTCFQGDAGIIKTFVGAALTGSPVATFLRTWWGSFSDGHNTSTTTQVGAYSLTEETDGSILVPPGVCLIANMAQAGAALTGSLSILYAELPWPL